MKDVKVVKNDKNTKQELIFFILNWKLRRIFAFYIQKELKKKLVAILRHFKLPQRSESFKKMKKLKNSEL